MNDCTPTVVATPAIDWTGIDLRLYGMWKGFGLKPQAEAFCEEEQIPNEYASALYRRAKVGLNLYRTSMGFSRNAPQIAHAESLSPRASWRDIQDEKGWCTFAEDRDARTFEGAFCATLIRTVRKPLNLERRDVGVVDRARLDVDFARVLTHTKSHQGNGAMRRIARQERRPCCLSCRKSPAATSRKPSAKLFV